MKYLIKLSLICSLIGLFLIIFLANHLEPPISPLSEIDERDLEEIVKVQGEIVRVIEHETLILFTLEDETGKIDCVFYNDFPFYENENVEVIGEVVEYKGKIEIEATKINLLE